MHIVLVFLLLGGFCQESKGIEKCVTLGGLSTVWGIYKLWYGSSVLHVGVNIRS